VVKDDCSIISTFGFGLRDVDRDKVLCHEFLKELLQPRPYRFYLKLSNEGVISTTANLIFLTYILKKRKKRSKIMLLKFTERKQSRKCEEFIHL